MIETFEQSVLVHAPIEEVFDFFSVAANLARLTPPWVGFDIVSPEPIEMRVGAVIEYRIRLHGLPLTWTSEITAWEPPDRFVDTQQKGPYKSWVHEHRFRTVPEGTLVEDRVEYELPLGALGGLARGFVRRDVGRIFAHRQHVVEELFG